MASKYKFICVVDEMEDTEYPDKMINTVEFSAEKMSEVLEGFKQFLYGCGYSIELVDHIIELSAEQENVLMEYYRG